MDQCIEYRKIIAIIRTWSLKAVERELEKLGVHLSFTYTKGRGEFADYLSPSELDRHARVEIFTEIGSVEKIVATIMEGASRWRRGPERK